MTRKILPPSREQIEGVIDRGRSLASETLTAAKKKLTSVRTRWSKFDPERRRSLGLIGLGLGIVFLVFGSGWRINVLSHKRSEEHQLESLLSEPDKEFLDNIPEGPISPEDIPLLTEAGPFMELIKNYNLPVEYRGAVLEPSNGGVLLGYEGGKVNDKGVSVSSITALGYLGEAIVNRLGPEAQKEGYETQTVFVPISPNSIVKVNPEFLEAILLAVDELYAMNGGQVPPQGLILLPAQFLPDIGFIDSFDKEGLLKNHLKGVALPLTKSTLDAPNIERLNEDIGEGNLNQLMIPLNNLPRIAGLMGLPKKVMVFFNPRFRGNEENNPSNPIPRDRRTPSTPTPAPQPSGQFVA